jgi:MFS family permease
VIKVLRNRCFRRLWLGSLLAAMGFQVSRVALILYVFHATGSVFDLAMLIVLEALPAAVVAPLGGAVIDGLGKRGVLVACNLALAALALLLLLRPSPATAYLMAGLQSALGTLFQSARAAAVPLVVAPDDLPRANGIEQSAANLVLVAGPLLGAELVKRAGLPAAVIGDVVFLLLSTHLVAGVRVGRAEGGAAGGRQAGSLAGVWEGWAYVARHRLALPLYLLQFGAMLCAGMWAPLAPFVIRDRAGAPDQLLGWQLSVFGAGGALGGLIAPGLVRHAGLGATLRAGLLAEGASLTLYALIPGPGASLVIMVLWGVAVSVTAVSAYSLLQGGVDESYLGRVMAALKQCEGCAAVLAVCLALVLGTVLSSSQVLLGAGLLFLGITAASSLSRGGRMLLMTR